MKKILIKAPSNREELLLSFPFFFALRQEFGDAEINVIVNDNLPFLYDFMKVKLGIKTYSFPLVKNSILGIHHYSYNLLDIFNIDLFFDLDDSFKSAFMGFAFRAHERVGIINGANRFWLTKKIKKNMALKRFYDEYYLQLLKSYTDKNFDNLKVCDAEIIDPLPVEIKEDTFNEEEDISFVSPPKTEEVAPVVVGNFLISIKEEDSLDIWKEFFDCFVSQSFLIVDNREGDDRSDLLKKFTEGERADIKNIFKIIKNIGQLELRELITEAMCVVSDEFWFANLVGYLGKKSYVFMNQDEQIPFVKYFKLPPTIVKFYKKIPVRVTSDFETRQVLNIGEVVDLIHQDLKI